MSSTNAFAVIWSPMTVAFWSHTDVLGRAMIARGGNSYLIVIDGAGGLDLYVSPSWQVGPGTAGTVAAAAKQHICCVYGSPTNLYVNGVASANYSPAGVAANAAEATNFLNRGDGNGVWDGRVS